MWRLVWPTMVLSPSKQKEQANTSAELDKLLHQLNDEVNGQMERSEQLVACQTQLSDANKRLFELVAHFKIQ